MKTTHKILCFSFAFSVLTACVPHQNSFNQSNASDTSVVDMYAAETTAQLKKKKEFAVMAATKEVAKEGLKDPSSAQFRNVRIVSWGSEKVVCGEINAKNSYGGYVGFKRFVGSPTRVTIEPVSVSTRMSGYDAQLLRDLNQACGR